LQTGRGESLEDTARTLSAYLHALVVRMRAQGRLEALAAAASVPVINALSDFAHPCQALADLQTIREYKRALDGVKLAYLGDGNNVANSLLCAGAMAGMHVTVGSPSGYEPIPQIVELAQKLGAQTGGHVDVTPNPLEAARGADAVAGERRRSRVARDDEGRSAATPAAVDPLGSQRRDWRTGGSPPGSGTLCRRRVVRLGPFAR
jgi:ornithine carbamoyltransferase